MKLTSEKSKAYYAAKREFVANLKTLIAEKGWDCLSHRKVAALLNNDCDPSVFFPADTIKNWRNGYSLPRYENFLQLAERLDCETTDLLSIEQQGILQIVRRSKTK